MLGDRRLRKIGTKYMTVFRSKVKFVAAGLGMFFVRSNPPLGRQSPRKGLSLRLGVQNLLNQQQNAYADQCGGEPAATVDVFMQQKFGQNGRADVGE